MAEYLTNDTDLGSVADAIRTKGGTSASLTYPGGFVSAIQAIQTGTDVSDTTATAGDVLNTKYFYTAAGVKTQGSIANGTITNNTSGGTSSGTINRGSQIKIGAGYYSSDAYYTAQSNSGTKTISASGTTSVDGYANASVAAGSATTPATTITAAPSISVSSSGLITATNSKTQSVTPTVSAGYVSSGTAGTITVSGSNTQQMTTKATTTYNTSTSDQTIASGTYLTGTQTIKAVTTSNINAGNIKGGVTITVGDANSSTRIKNVTGVYGTKFSTKLAPHGTQNFVSGNFIHSYWGFKKNDGTYLSENDVTAVGSFIIYVGIDSINYIYNAMHGLFSDFPSLSITTVKASDNTCYYVLRVSGTSKVTRQYTDGDTSYFPKYVFSFISG